MPINLVLVLVHGHGHARGPIAAAAVKSATAKVNETKLAALLRSAEHDIVGFDVAMDDLVLGAVIDCTPQLMTYATDVLCP